MSMELMDPGADGDGGPTRVTAPRLASLDGKKIGLLSNGKANAELLLRETAARFEKEHGCSVVHFIDKRNAGKPADPAYLAKLAAEADFLITAVGD
ncbi:MAG: hypothetical protein VYC36_09270 [Pseudomonadota bacterium]|nr:hypothetical protein [Pseudomonadota bacterium]